jgi:hypothetical protein
MTRQGASYELVEEYHHADIQYQIPQNYLD